MQKITFPCLLNRLRQAQVSQHLTVPTIDRGDSPQGRSIDKSHARAGRVDAIRLQTPLSHLAPELLQIKFHRLCLVSPKCATLAMDNLLLMVLTVDLKTA